MPGYQGRADRSDRAKAFAGVLLVHAALAALILSGRSVASVRHVVDRLNAFDISLPPLPPPSPPRQAERARAREGTPASKTPAAPILVPKPTVAIPQPSPVVAAVVPGTGAATSQGAAGSGRGSGAGGSGNGPGGGGGSAARWLDGGIYDSDNRAGRFQGVVAVNFTVLANGRVADCTVSRASGNAELDALTCALLQQRLRFSPARDSFGRPISSAMGTTFTWGVRRHAD